MTGSGPSASRPSRPRPSSASATPTSPSASSTPPAVEFRDDGTPKDVERLLADVLTRSPYLARPGAAADFGGGVRGSGPSGTDMNRLIRRAAGRT